MTKASEFGFARAHFGYNWLFSPLRAKGVFTLDIFYE